MSVAFSPDGNVLAACNGRSRLHIWQAPPLNETGLVNFGGR